MTAKRKRKTRRHRPRGLRPRPSPRKSRGHRPGKRDREKARRERISAALRAYHKSGKTKAQRATVKRERDKRRKARLPKGFERIDPTPGILEMLAQSAEEMRAKYGLDSSIRHAVNADETVAYEARFILPKKPDMQKVLTDLAGSLRPVPRAWYTIGFRFAPKSVDEEIRKAYERYKGMEQVQAYTQKATAGKIVALEATAEQILANVEAKRGWKPSEVFVRLFWSPYRPQRKSNLKR